MKTTNISDKNLPLVSVNVVSYNASDTIKETLDSIFLQSYHNIELIISDDCSKDNTVEICKDWMSTHQNRFVRVVLLTADKNLGIVRNCNRVRRESQGEWIKGIAADDKLFPNCIEDYVNYCMQNPDAKIVTSIQKVYNNTFDEENCTNPNSICKDLSIFEKSANEQLKIIAYRVTLNAPTIFFKKSLFDELGGYDERYSYEDHPFYIKVLEAGNKIYFMNKVTVGYRVHDSVFNSNERLFNFDFIKQAKKFRWERCFRYYNWRQKLSVRAYFFLMQIMESCGLNKKTPLISKVYKIAVGIIFRFGD
jgi:alpha-1,3-rhamnosyltransferase